MPRERRPRGRRWGARRTRRPRGAPRRRSPQPAMPTMGTRCASTPCTTGQRPPELAGGAGVRRPPRPVVRDCPSARQWTVHRCRRHEPAGLLRATSLPPKRGRIVLAGGGLSTSDTTRVVDWRSTTGRKAYKGKAVLVLWVAPVTGDDATLPLQLTGQVYIRKSNGTLQAEGSAVTAALLGQHVRRVRLRRMAAGVDGVQREPVQPLATNEFIGVRVWNSATAATPADATREGGLRRRG